MNPCECSLLVGLPHPAWPAGGGVGATGMDLNSRGTLGGASGRFPLYQGPAPAPIFPTPMTGSCLFLSGGQVSSPPSGSRPCHFLVFGDPHQRPKSSPWQPRPSQPSSPVSRGIPSWAHLPDPHTRTHTRTHARTHRPPPSSSCISLGPHFPLMRMTLVLPGWLDCPMRAGP